VRPHLLDIARLPSGGSHFRGRIKHINSAGPLVKVEIVAEWGDPVRVEMPQERFRSLQLLKNEEVFVIPKDVKVFPGKDIARAQ
jgi:sulfate/thiosulfate transport system ATP-binding protein